MALSLVAQACFFFTPISLPAVTINIFLIGATSIGLGPTLQTHLLDVAPSAQMLAALLNHSALNVANALGTWLGGAVFAVSHALERTPCAVPSKACCYRCAGRHAAFLCPGAQKPAPASPAQL